MRVVKDLTLQGCKVTLFHWNNRYLIKFEVGAFEQTFKVNEFDFTDDQEVIALLDDTFVEETLARFSAMAQSLHDARQRV